MNFKGILGVSLIDYPGNICSILFTGGCDLACPFCQNTELVLYPHELPDISEEEVLEFLEDRQGFIDGVSITGGEPLLHDDLPEFMKRVKELGLLVKVDTNGTRPDMLEKLISSRNVDYIAMDVKSSPQRYRDAAGRMVDLKKIENSIRLILDADMEYEFKTTAVPTLVDRQDVEIIANMIRGAKLYAIHQFVSLKTLDNSLTGASSYTPEELKELASVAAPFVEQVIIRGI